MNSELEEFNFQDKVSCPWCRGHISSWTIVNRARLYLEEKKRNCDKEHCTFF